MQAVDIQSKEFEAYLTKLVLQIMKQALLETPPRDELSTLLHLHIKDMQTFKLYVEHELQKINDSLTTTKQELQEIRDTMATKKELQEIRDTMATKQELQEIKDTMATKKELQEIKDSMITKDFWNEEKNRLLQGIGEVVKSVIDNRFKS